MLHFIFHFYIFFIFFKFFQTSHIAYTYKTDEITEPDLLLQEILMLIIKFNFLKIVKS